MIGALYDFLSFFFPADWAMNNLLADPKSFSCYSMILLLIGVAAGIKVSFDRDGCIFRSFTPSQAKSILSFIAEDGYAQEVKLSGDALDFDICALEAGGMVHEIKGFPIRTYVISPAWFARVKRHRRLLRHVSERKCE